MWIKFDGNELCIDNFRLCFEHMWVSTYDKISGETLCTDSGYWYKVRYNAYGKELDYKNSIGTWRKKTYNSFGNCTHHQDSTGYWWSRKYTKKGKLIEYSDSTGNFQIY